MTGLELNLEKKDWPYVILLTIFNILLVSTYILFNEQLGIYCSDVFVYLLNGLYFNGINIDSTSTIWLSPVICYLTSILFNLGISGEIAIYIVTGVFAIVGNICLYFLFRFRFNQLLSILGSLCYSSFSLYLLWLANGSLDIPVVSLTILVVFFWILAIDKNPKYYLIAAILIVLGIFTRYTIVLVLPALMLYFIYKKKSFILHREFFTSKEFRYLLISILVACLLAVLILNPIVDLSENHLGFVSQGQSVVGGDKGSSIDSAYTEDYLFYIHDFPNYLSSFSTEFDDKTPILEKPTIMAGFFIVLLIVGLLLFIKNNKFNKKYLLITAVLFAFSLIIINLNIILAMLLLFIAMLSCRKIFKLSKNHDLALMLFAWLLFNLIFYSYYNIKVNRYIIPVLPVVSFFIVISLNEIYSKFRFNNKIISVILIVIFIVSSFSFIMTFDDNNEFKAPEEVSDFLINYDEDYEDKTIGVYNIRPFTWYFKEPVLGIVANETKLIDSSELDYYISNIKQDNLTNFTEIKNIDNLYLYERII